MNVEIRNVLSLNHPDKTKSWDDYRISYHINQYDTLILFEKEKKLYKIIPPENCLTHTHQHYKYRTKTNMATIMKAWKNKESRCKIDEN